MGHVANDGEYDKTSKDTREAIAHGHDVRIPVETKNNIWKFCFMKEDEVVVVVRLEHSHSFNDSLDNHFTASGPARRGEETTQKLHLSREYV